MERRPISLVDAWFTLHVRTERGAKRLACGNPGAIGSRCEAGLLQGTYERCRGVSTDQTTISVITDAVLTFGLKSWSRGQNSQASSCVCSGGVSAVKGSSDLDEHTLVSDGASGNQLSCSLPFVVERSKVEVVCVELDAPSMTVHRLVKPWRRILQTRVELAHSSSANIGVIQ